MNGSELIHEEQPKSRLEMGEPFYGTGKAPDGYKPGDYVEFLSGTEGWMMAGTSPAWFRDSQYRLEANHLSYQPPIWCLDKAAQDAGYAGWGGNTFGFQRLKESIIAHARTLWKGCAPMQRPIDPLLLAMREEHAQCFGIAGQPETAKAYRDGKYDKRLARTIDYVRDRFDITEKAK